MTDRELLEQALEALQADEYDMVPDKENHMVFRKEAAIAALRERLAQPDADRDWRHPKAQALIGAKARLEITLRLIEQLLEDPHFETTASDMEYWEPLHDKLRERLAQPEQEPVAWWHDMGGVVDLNVSGHGRPLYFAPPRREPFEAAAELRRLHEVNQELLKALKLAWPIIEYERFAQDCSYGNNFVQTKAERARGAHEAARAAIAKAEGKE